MNHRGLQLRMALVGSILLGFYLLLATVAVYGYGLNVYLVGVGTLGLVGFQYLLGTKMALWTTGAEDMPETEYGRIHDSVEELCAEMDLDKPRLMVADMGVPNAFATGRRGNGTVVVSRELIHVLEHEELEGVLAHELAHLDNRDVLTMTIGQSIAMLAGYAVYFLIAFTGERSLAGIVLGLIASMLVQTFVMLFVMAISRYREYVADADAAEALGRGEPLARALEKIQAGTAASGRQVDDDVAALCIFGDAESLLSTHPSTEKRIERLRTRV